jgi:hypothetical protein
MKKQVTALIFGLCLIVVVGWWFWPSAPPPKGKQTSIAQDPPSATKAPSVISAPVGTLPSATPDLRSKAERMSEILTLTSRTPIAFYGTVVDQNGDAIEGVKVTASIQAARYFMDEHWEQFFTNTNSKGQFQFLRLQGQDLGIFLEKKGYEFKSSSQRYAYSALTPERERHRPDPSAPVVFRMWRLKGAEPLAHVEVDRVGVPVNGAPTSFDIMTGKRMPSGGDVILKVERQPEHIQRGHRFDWRAIIEVPDGGIAELNDAYPNEAPANGYEAQFAIEMPATSKEWQSSVTRSFYVKARGGGIYARLTLRITADYEPPPTGVTLEAFVNPSGSRNLEYDPAKQASAR